MERHQRLMICHGFVVILIAMLAGFMLMFNLIGGIEVWPGVIINIPMYGTEAGWVRAHSGGTMKWPCWLWSSGSRCPNLT